VTGVRWDGLAAFQRDLHVLPQTLTDEARPIARTAADATAMATATRTVRRSGDLVAGISVSSRPAGSGGVAYVVRSAAVYAGVYESGSHGARMTAAGWNRGPMPAAHVLVPTAMRSRTTMRDALVGMVRAEGLKVHG